MSKRERLGTWVVSQAPGRFLNVLGYFHVALEGENYCVLMYRHMIHCGQPKISIKRNRHCLRMLHRGNEGTEPILLFLPPLPLVFQGIIFLL